jgi:hypothetical protein
MEDSGWLSFNGVQPWPLSQPAIGLSNADLSFMTQNSELTPKWANPGGPRRIGSRLLTVLAIVLIMVVAVAAVYVAIRFRSISAGQKSESVPLIPRKK